MNNSFGRLDKNEFEDLIRTAEITDIENERVYVCGYTELLITVDDDGDELLEENQCFYTVVIPSDENPEYDEERIYLSLLKTLVTQWDYDEIRVDKQNCFVQKICESECTEYYDFFVSFEISKEFLEKIHAKNQTDMKGIKICIR